MGVFANTTTGPLHCGRQTAAEQWTSVDLDLVYDDVGAALTKRGRRVAAAGCTPLLGRKKYLQMRVAGIFTPLADAR